MTQHGAPARGPRVRWHVLLHSKRESISTGRDVSTEYCSSDTGNKGWQPFLEAANFSGVVHRVAQYRYLEQCLQTGPAQLLNDVSSDVLITS